MSSSSQLEQLKKVTRVVADTGDFEAMRAYAPEDATTNPTLILKAVQQPQYERLLDQAVADNRSGSLSGAALVEKILNDLLILFGTEILRIIPGRVSTETDARLSFDTDGIIAQAHEFIDLYAQKGIARERILIKIASTWEGIKAAEVLEKEGIKCNLTLLFSMAQAIACAESKVQLISPFVGRIYDWYKKSTGKEYQGAEDPGVQSVQKIYRYYKKFDYATEVMGASFRNRGQIVALAGCDLLTISPNLLQELADSTEPIEPTLSVTDAKACDEEKIHLDEKSFRFLFNEDAMATEKTAEGIRSFAADAKKLEALITAKLT